MEIKVMIVPGKIARVEVPAGATVLAACEMAERQIPGVGWMSLAADREVRVQNRKFSNTAEAVEGTAGSIHSTPLKDQDVVLVLTKIKGNAGEAVLTCEVNGAEYALETPVTVHHLLAEVVGLDLSEVGAVAVNGDDADLDQLVGAGDEISVELVSTEETREPATAGTVTVVINGHTVTGAPEDIRKILG